MRHKRRKGRAGKRKFTKKGTVKKGVRNIKIPRAGYRL
jgi:hypothetical protein